MQEDDTNWSYLNAVFCTYKINTRTHEKLCRNTLNVTGLCNRNSCPLSNSKYATVREKGGKLYLMMKTPERAAYPNKLWERISLSENFETAYIQMKENLLHWPQFYQVKCKTRFIKLKQSIIRSRKLKLQRQKLLVPVKSKIDKREKTREEKALNAARIEIVVEKQLAEREKLKGELVESDLAKEYRKRLERENQMESDLEEEYQMESDLENEYRKRLEREKKMENALKDDESEFVTDISESEEEDDIEDMAEIFEQMPTKRKADDRLKSAKIQCVSK